MGVLPDAEVGSLRVVGLPNLWAHANADFAMTTRLTPIDAGTTDVEVCFLVRADARLDDADVEALTAVWRAGEGSEQQLEAHPRGGRVPHHPLDDRAGLLLDGVVRQGLEVAAVAGQRGDRGVDVPGHVDLVGRVR